MRSDRFRWLANAEGPFASVYFDDTHDTADAVDQLEARWSDIRKHLDDLGAGAEMLGMIEDAVLNHRPAIGRRGRAVIATRDRVLINEPLTEPLPAPVVRLSDYPYVVPLIELEMHRPTYVFAAVDHAGADVTLFQGDNASRTSIDGGGYPVHKPATAGFNGYGDFQHTTEEAIRMNCRAVADEITRIVDKADPEVVFVCGEVRARADVVAELPRRAARRVSELHAGSRKRGFDDEEIRLLTAGEFDRRRRIETTEITDQFEAETGRGSGLAAEGIAAVCAALREGDVDTLFVGELGDATVVTGQAPTMVAPDADVLSDFGQPVKRLARADEALPFAAIAVGAALVRTNDLIAPADGVGALLRYVAADRANRRGA